MRSRALPGAPARGSAHPSLIVFFFFFFAIRMESPLEHTDAVAAALNVVPAEPLTRKIYLVVESDSEYNDEYSYTVDGYFAMAAYATHDAAQAEADRRNEEYREVADAEHWQDGEVPNLYKVVTVTLTEAL